ncbi:MAG: transporter, partial [Brevibacillus sp.]|nr:transporter [Brevibacillus sp.]
MISKGAKWIGWTGVLMLVIVFLLALIGPYVVTHDAEKQTGMPFQPPGAEHWLGTNDMGQDIMAELVVGARTSLTIGVAAALLATLIGTAIGLV